MPLVTTVRRAGAASSSKAGSGLAAAKAALSKAAATTIAVLQNLGNSVMLGSLRLGEGLSSQAHRQLVWWLGGTTLLAYGVIVLGGATRVHRSLLSIKDIKLAGVQLPMSAMQWQALYDQYRSTAEYARANSPATFDDFKFVTRMEFGLKAASWLLGLAFVLPGAYFAKRGFINAPLAKRLGLVLLLGGGQVLLGSWSTQRDWDTPHVQPYRPAAHLISAFTIYTTLAWTVLDLAYPKPLLSSASLPLQTASQQARLWVLLYGVSVALTAVTGSFVAGRDAGRKYNTYPDMDGKFVPDEWWDMSLRPLYRNMVENVAANQFHHRMAALTTALAAPALWVYVRAKAVPAPVKRAMDAVLGVTMAQVALGIWTLVQHVPGTLGTLHQANTLNSISVVLVALHMLRPSSLGPFRQSVVNYWQRQH